MKLKNIPYYFSQGILALGSSITLGLLSFAGMVAFLTHLITLGIFIPIIPVAIATFVLAIAYEGQIYLENIKDFFRQMFKPNYLNHLLAKEYLLNNLINTLQQDDCPQFFKDYAEKLEQLNQYAHKSLDKQSQQHKKAIEKTLKDMEHVLALALFAKPKLNKSDYFKGLSHWLNRNQHKSTWQAEHKKRGFYFRIINLFSLVAGVFTGLGLPFLIADILATSAFIATLPFAVWLVLIPICMIASAMVTSRSITKFINNDTVNKWCKRIYKRWSDDGFTLSNVLVTLGISTLLVLAGLLTICTGGTWLTVASSPEALIQWVTKLPGFVMGVINPIIVVISSGFFNVQNIAETLDLMEKGENPFVTFKKEVIKFYERLKDKENWFQRVNPFRILLKLTLTPLRIILFLGHLLSIAVSTDRVPGISESWAILIALINEGFEDAHYFVKEVHHHHHQHHGDDPYYDRFEHIKEALEEHLDSSHEGHNHDTDIPTFILKSVFAPIYCAAALWDWAFSHLNQENGKPVLSFTEAFKKQLGIEEEPVAPTQADLSPAWLKEQVDYRIEKYKTKHFKNLFYMDSLAKEKLEGLTQLQQDLRNPENDFKETLKNAKNREVFNQNRLFIHKPKTETHEFLGKLPQETYELNKPCIIV